LYSPEYLLEEELNDNAYLRPTPVGELRTGDWIMIYGSDLLTLGVELHEHTAVCKRRLCHKRPVTAWAMYGFEVVRIGYSHETARHHERNVTLTMRGGIDVGHNLVITKALPQDFVVDLARASRPRRLARFTPTPSTLADALTTM
jgi:predicted RNA binding protein YcfA (HicA-like mRNA interferase family)